MRHSLKSRLAVTAAALLLVISSIASQSLALSSMISMGTWFKIGAEAAKDWQISQPGDDKNILLIKPKRLLSSRPLRHVLVLYPRASSAYDTAITKIVGIFADKRIDAEFTINHFGLDEQRGKAALKFAEHNNYDLVLAMGSESTAWLWSSYRGGRIPVVSVCSKDPVLLGQMQNYEHGSGTNFAFTSLNMPIDAQMSYVMQLRPNLKNLAILVDSNNLSAMQTQAAPAAQFARARGIRAFELALKSPANAKEELARLVHDAVEVMRKNDPDLTDSVFWITGSTTVFAEITTINANSFRVPVLSTVTDVVQPGDNTAVLSVGISFESNAYQAALYAIEILEGHRKPGDMAVGIVSPPDVAISFRKAREIGMRMPFTLFEGATVIYDNDGNLVRSSGPAPVRTIASESSPAPLQPEPQPAASNAFSIE